MSEPDDIARLGGHLFVSFQNGVGAKGEPAPSGTTNSTVAEYTLGGRQLNSWSLKGKCDGLTGDQAHHRLIATVNEDGNSSLYTIIPTASKGGEIRHYHYSPSPLPHGGGSDAPSIVGGKLLISASAPAGPSGPALYAVNLSGDKAIVHPVFSDNSEAQAANTTSSKNGARTKLALTDPDSNGLVPGVSPRFAGDFVLDSQGDQEQIYVSNIGTPGQRLNVLNLAQAINDTAWATSVHGTLYVTDNANNKLVAVTGQFQPGSAFVAATPADNKKPSKTPGYLGQLNLTTGAIQPVISTFQPSGLLFIPSAPNKSSITMPQTGGGFAARFLAVGLQGGWPAAAGVLALVTGVVGLAYRRRFFTGR